MTMLRWEPFGEMRRMDAALNRLWRGLDLRSPLQMAEGWDVPLDILDKEKEIVVKASLPDIEPEKVEVAVEEGVLTIRGETSTEKETKEADYYMKERRSGSFFRSVRLPDAVDADKAKSVYVKGVLTVTFPKVAAKKAKKVKVEVTAG